MDRPNKISDDAATGTFIISIAVGFGAYFLALGLKANDLVSTGVGILSGVLALIGLLQLDQ